MRKKIYLFFILILFIETTCGKGNNKTSVTNISHKNHSHMEETSNKGRSKRSVPDGIERSYLIKEKNFLNTNSNYDTGYTDSDNEKERIERDPPFWGTRGRRDSSSLENFNDKLNANNNRYNRICKHCYKALLNENDPDYNYAKERRDELGSPFWGNRGRRSSDEDYSYSDGFIRYRDRKQDNEPFWGTRGRRFDDSEPFWGNRGRRENAPFNEERKPDSPFWGSRGRRDDVEPFWGNRGRRDALLTSSRNLDRREETEPFWGNRGRRKEYDIHSENRDKQIDLKESIQNVINKVEDDIERLSRLRRSKDMPESSFWHNRGRDSQLRYMFNGARFNKFHVPKSIKSVINSGVKMKPSESSTVLDDRVYAEQPRYIIVERSSRSSSEDDPFYISRGKKKIHNLEMFQAARDRRGAIEELVKSVRNDPFYIARGKKDSLNGKIGNSTFEELGKAKELICAIIDLIMINSESNKVKREVDDSERDRRTILKKLAAQLQIDPYFVSRGKKNDDTATNLYDLKDFINEISIKCH